MAFTQSFAAISDIHGNIFALEAVLGDIAQRGIERIVNLGDHLYGPLDPIATAELLIPINLPSIRSNCDRWLYEAGTIAPPGRTIAKNRLALSEQHRCWLEEMPQTLQIDDDVLLCHGTPWADDVYLLEDVDQNGVHPRSVDDLAIHLSEVSAKLVLCGHSHRPGSAQLLNGTVVVNPGSVGLQVYTDESPYPHAMEAGTPHARYAVFTREDSQWQFEHLTVSYDWEQAAKLAEQNGRSDWARWLRTGRV